MALEEEHEALMREKSELEERIRRRAETIRYFEDILGVTRAEHPALTHRELMIRFPAYRGTFYSVRSLRGWQARNRKRIEEIEEVVPPHRWVRIVITFSIETGEGHEIFFAEVTCETVIPEEETPAIKRIVNATIKLFWTLFDVQKALYDLSAEQREFRGLKPIPKADYDEIVRRKEFIQKHATIDVDVKKWIEALEAHPLEVRETYMDRLLRVIIGHGGLEREPDEYVTVEALIKIGVEEPKPAPPTAEPKYPMVYMLVEKGKSAETKGEYTLGAKLLVAPETDVDILEKLKMKYEE